MEILIGAVVSAVVQLVKRLCGTSNLATLITLLLISFIAAGTYYFVAQSNFGQSFYQILLYAAGIWAVISGVAGIKSSEPFVQ